MTVGDDDAFDLVLVAFHIGEVRDDDVDTEHLRFRERETAVEDDHIAIILEQGHVLADLVETAEERDFERKLERSAVLFLRRVPPPVVLLVVIRFSGHKFSFYDWVFAMYQTPGIMIPSPPAFIY